MLVVVEDDDGVGAAGGVVGVAVAVADGGIRRVGGGVGDLAGEETDEFVGGEGGEQGGHGCFDGGEVEGNKVWFGEEQSSGRFCCLERRREATGL